ncbi:MAG: metallophosphoesterase [Lachnospiraceae bacterium]|nr:metallophosphoesterase [Lachnospiraceae bacterium]
MKILIVSDTHRFIDNFKKAAEKVAPIDLLIHCGDSERNEETFSQITNCPVELVAGNNDYFSSLPREKEFMLGRYKVWLVHGHRHYVTFEMEEIRQEALGRNADILMFGHTHKPLIDIKHDLIMINPGSLTYPRQDGRRSSFIVMELDKNGEAHFTINYL